jgi:hypothetical protein
MIFVNKWIARVEYEFGIYGRMIMRVLFYGIVQFVGLNLKLYLILRSHVILAMFPNSFALRNGDTLYC